MVKNSVMICDSWISILGFVGIYTFAVLTGFTQKKNPEQSLKQPSPNTKLQVLELFDETNFEVVKGLLQRIILAQCVATETSSE